jgi:sugar (pentulose or hexulose) kinase
MAVNHGNRNMALAALDIGTSQIKLGVYFPPDSPSLSVLGSIRNEITFGANGGVTSSYGMTREASFTLFNRLGKFLRSCRPDSLCLGLSGHVSSLLEWDRKSGRPARDDFPIWMDSTCSPALDTFSSILGDGRRMLGSFLPPGTNWLLTKLLHQGDPGQGLYLQAGDAIFYELSGRYASHYSSQISLVHHSKREYVGKLLNAAGVGKPQLPALSTGANAVLQEMCQAFGWPENSHVFPSMADFYASFYGLRLNPRERFVLGSTSEIAGLYRETDAQVTPAFVSLPFAGGHIDYGSANTGSNTVSWFVRNILGQEISTGVLEALTSEAARVHPGEAPIFLPYIAGERAPFWDRGLKASFAGLQLHHQAPHLFRSVLESVAFARRQCFEHLGAGFAGMVKMGGGSSTNSLWNVIRASVLNSELAVAMEKELAIGGLIYCLAEKLQMPAPALHFSAVLPDRELVPVYEKKYREFLQYQKMLLSW